MRKRLPDIEQWRKRALALMHTVHGRQHTQDELEFVKEFPDKWDYFRVFGIQPETQTYIDHTIDLLENKCSTHAQRAICRVRVAFTMRALRSIK